MVGHQAPQLLGYTDATDYDMPSPLIYEPPDMMNQGVGGAGAYNNNIPQGTIAGSSTANPSVYPGGLVARPGGGISAGIGTGAK